MDIRGQGMHRSARTTLSQTFQVASLSIGLLVSLNASADVNNGTLTIDKNAFAKDQRVIIKFEDSVESKKDWLAIFKAGEIGNSCAEQEDYLTWKYTNPKNGSVGFSHLPPGNYEAQLFSNDSYCHVGDALAFEVLNKSSKNGSTSSRTVSAKGAKVIDDPFMPKRKTMAQLETRAAKYKENSTEVIAPLGDAFKLHSRPGASKVIYLDFDGHVGEDGNYDAFDIDNNGSSFSDAERLRIQEIWKSVSEDFTPFEVDVTTEFPGIEALRKRGSQDTKWGIRAVVSDSVYDNSWAYVGSFDSDDDREAFVYSGNTGWIWIADAASHEIGHTMGLHHDGTNSGVRYYEGHDAGNTHWTPIMGWSGWEYSQWDKGEYQDTNNSQDDLKIITSQNGFGYRNDDYGSSMATASVIDVIKTTLSSVVNGLIERNTDKDFFEFTLPQSGPVQLKITPDSLSPNLYMGVKIHDANGTVIHSATPNADLAVVISKSMASGTYYLSIEGVGVGNPGNNTGFSDYGSLGYYSVAAKYTSSGNGGSGGNNGTPGSNGNSGNSGNAGNSDSIPVTMSKAQFKVGETIRVKYSQSKSTIDWIGIFNAGVNASCQTSDGHIDFKYATSSSGTVVFTGIAAGQYEVQMFSNDSYCHIGAAAELEVIR